MTAMTTGPVATALLGVGRMGSFHARALAGGAPDVEIVAIADPSRDALESTGAHVVEAARYTSFEQALAHPGLEACLVATPTPTHPEVVAAALDAGLHVLCEKPLALDPEVGDGLGERARSTGLILQIGFWRRFSPPWASAKRLIDEGRIGQPVMVRLSQWDADPPPPAFCDPTVSGGLAIDCGVHEFDLAEWLTGEPVRQVQAWNLPLVDSALGSVGDVDNLVAVLQLDSGAVAIVDLSRNARYGDDVRTEVLGSDGAIFVDLLPRGRTRLATTDGVEVVAGSEVDDPTEAGVIAQATAFARHIRGEELRSPGAAASSRTTRIGTAVVEAASSGQTIVL